MDNPFSEWYSENAILYQMEKVDVGWFIFSPSTKYWSLVLKVIERTEAEIICESLCSRKRVIRHRYDRYSGSVVYMIPPF